jgi:hypothetical protein
MMPSLVTSTAPLVAAGTFTSGWLQISRAISLTGTVFSDQDGTLFLDQGGDGVNADYTISVAVTGGDGADVDIPLISQWFQVRYVNETTGQDVFRLNVDARDPYGAFLQPALTPSDGGAWAVLMFQPGSGLYSYVGRFDASDGFNACGNAALSTGRQGKYAATLVTNFTVSDEAILKNTEHTPESF